MPRRMHSSRPRLAKPCERLVVSRCVLGLAVALVAVLASCSEDESPDAVDDESRSVPGHVEAGEIVTFPCARPTLAPASGSEWASEAESAPDGANASRRFVEAGRHRWLCVDQSLGGTVDVVPGPAHEVVWPELPEVVRRGASVVRAAVVRDAFGNALDLASIEYRVEADQPDAARIDDDRIRFLSPGRVRVVASVHHAQGAPEVAPFAIDVLVDAGPPLIRVANPRRGTIVSRDVGTGVRVSGIVEEGTPGVALTIDGNPVDVADDGQFETIVVPDRTGLTVLEFVASDRAGYVTRSARAVLWGPLRDPRNGLDAAVRVFLPTWIIDDDDTEDLDDLASAVHVLLDTLDFPSQRIDLGCNGTVRLERVTLEPSAVDLAPRHGGFDVAVALRDVSVRVSGEACGCAFGRSVGCIDVEGSVGTARIDAAVDVAVGASGPTSVEATEVDLDLAPLTIHWSFLWGGLDWAIELFEEEIREQVVSAVREAILDKVQAELGTVLDAALPAQSLALPPPLDDRVVLETHLARLSTSDAGVFLELDTRAASDDPSNGWIPPRAVALGSPKTLGTRGALGSGGRRLTVRASGRPPDLPDDKVGIAVSLDVVNDAIFALYDRGALDEMTIDLEALGLSTRGALGPLVISARLPPMLLPGREAGSLRLVVGDLHVAVETRFDVVEMYVSLDVEARFRVDERENDLVVELVEDGMRVHFEAASPADEITMAATFQDVESMVRLVVDHAILGRETRLALPVLDLGQIEGVPASRAGALELRNASLDVTLSGYLTVLGTLEQRAR